MRLLYVLPETPLNANAGIATYVGHAIQSHVDAGHDVHLLTWRFVEGTQPLLKHSLPLDKSHIHVLELAAARVWDEYPTGPWAISLTHHLADVVANFVRDILPDVIETCDYTGPLVGYLLRRRSGFYPDIANIPVLCYNHGLIRPVYAADFTPVQEGVRLEMANEREALRLADVVLVPSAAAGKVLRDECGRLDNLAPLPEPFVPRERKSHESGSGRYVHLGRLSMAKGVDYCVHFLNAVDPIKSIDQAVFIGRHEYIQFKHNDPGSYLNAKLAPRIRERLKLVGAIPYSEVRNHLAGGGFSLNFSRLETFNYTFLEMLDAGLLPYTRAETAMAEFMPPELRKYVLPADFDLLGLRDVVEDYHKDGKAIHATIMDYAFQKTAPAVFSEEYWRLVDDARVNRKLAARTKRQFNSSDVTILMATYNPRGTILEAIDSVFAQTAPVREVVVVDDGSTVDASLELLSQLDSRPQLRVVRSQANEGLSATRVKLIREVRSDLSVFLDDDDALAPQFVEYTLRALNENPRADAAIPWRRNFGINTATITSWHMDDYEYALSNELRMTALVTTDAMRAISFTPAMRNGEADDWDFWLKFKIQGRTAISVPIPLFLYRFYEGSMSWPWSTGQRIGTSNTIAQRTAELWKQGALPDAFIREVMTSYFGRQSHSPNETAHIARGNDIQRAKERYPIIGLALETVYRGVTSVARRMHSR